MHRRRVEPSQGRARRNDVRFCQRLPLAAELLQPLLLGHDLAPCVCHLSLERRERLVVGNGESMRGWMAAVLSTRDHRVK